jgi:hypothetical protein
VPLASGNSARPSAPRPTDDDVAPADRGARLAAAVALAALVCGAAVGLVAYRQLGPAGRFTAGIVAFTGFAVVFTPRVRPFALTRRRVLVATAFLVAVAVLTPPRGSHDVWSYAMYGRILSVHGANPFTRVPAEFTGDPFLHLVSVGWRHTASVYGPVFVGFAGFVTAVAGSSALASRLLFQGVEAVALFGVLWVLWRRTRSPAALAFVGLNPVVLIVVNGGHNDLLVGLALLGGTVLLAGGRPRLAGVVLALGALVKLVLLLPIGALVFWAWRRRGSRAALEVGTTAGGLVVGAYVLAGGTRALAPLLHARGQHSRSSVWQLAVRWLAHPSARLGHGVAATVGDLALVTISVLAVLLVVRGTRSGQALRLATATSAAVLAGAVALAYLLAAWYVLPWYSAWSLPVLALVWNSRVAFIGAAQAAVIGVAYTAPLAVGGILGAAFRVYAQTLVPIALLIALVALARFGRRGRLDDPVGAMHAPLTSASAGSAA